MSPEDRPPRLFLLEDDEAVVSVVQGGAGREAWEFQACGLLDGALDSLRSFQPDMLLLDLHLPDGDGLDLCRQMKADGPLAKVPVIILTSKGDVDSRLKGFEAGAEDYVVKPFLLPELLARVRAHLNLKSRRDDLEKELADNRLHERIRQDVLDMVVHDLRAPLTTVKVTLDLCRESRIVKKPFLEYLQLADSALDFSIFMLNDLLDLGEGTVMGEAAPLDIGALCANLEKLFGVRYRTKDTKLEFDPAKAQGRAFASDQVLLYRILVNLLDNSLKFSKPGGTVSVTVQPTKDGTRWELQDCGPGIPDSEKEAVFLKFYRSRSEQAKSVPGHGIGLAFCKLAAQALRGRIWIEDGKGGGTRFIIELPSLPPGTKLSVQAAASKK